jgi:hypothetical protein
VRLRSAHDQLSIWVVFLTVRTLLPGLKYLEFHHLASAPLDNPSASSTPSGKKPKKASAGPIERLNDGAPGLQEVDDTKDLLLAAERVGRKEWLRSALGMTGKGS